jgi:hypothetical protein
MDRKWNRACLRQFVMEPQNTEAQDPSEELGVSGKKSE